jgi:hypothetical protein
LVPRSATPSESTASGGRATAPPACAPPATTGSGPACEPEAATFAPSGHAGLVWPPDATPLPERPVSRPAPATLSPPPPLARRRLIATLCAAAHLVAAGCST